MESAIPFAAVAFLAVGIVLRIGAEALDYLLTKRSAKRL